MKVVSTNIGEKRMVQWRGKEVATGIFKFPVQESIHLGFEDVVNDHVIDRKYHGGIDKACYIYSADHYPFWKEHYPKLDFSYGLFGENVTIEGLDESSLQIGDIYQLGSAKIQISQPRQPCFKLGIRFGTQTILKKFINNPYPGSYLRIIEEGAVQTGDTFELIEQHPEGLSLVEIYSLLYANGEQGRIKTVLTSSLLTKELRDNLTKRMAL